MAHDNIGYKEKIVKIRRLAGRIYRKFCFKKLYYHLYPIE